MAKRKVHYRNIRLMNNAGMEFPECRAGAALLDLDAGRLKMTAIKAEVTCLRCRRILGLPEDRGV